MVSEITKQVIQGLIGDFHPYATATEREKWDLLPADVQKKLVEEGEKYINFNYQMLPTTRYMEFCRVGNRSHFEDLYFTRRRVVNALVLAECVEDKGRFVDDIINGIVAICEESGWQLPAHNSVPGESSLCIPDYRNPILDLFACETGAQLAMALYLLGEKLDQVTPLLRKRIVEEIRNRILTPYVTKHFHWMGVKGKKVNNWTPWCTQNTLLACLLPGFLLQEEKKKVIEKASNSLDIFLDTYGDDGCCNEGASYYRAAGLCLFQSIEILNGVSDNAYASLYENTKVKNIAPYIMNMHVDDEYYANFSDCSPKAGRAGIRDFLFAKRVENMEMMQYAAEDHRKDENILLSRSENLYYRVQAAFTEQEIRSYNLGRAAMKHDIFYESVGVFIARDSKYFLAVKAGNNDDSHNHNDCGSITVYRNGRPLLIDVGVETYCKKTFSPNRYEIWTMQSLYHNVVNFGDNQQLPGENYKAKVTKVSLQDNKAEIKMNLEDCYEEGVVTKYERSVVFEKEKKISVTDYCETTNGNACLTLMTQQKPIAGKDNVIFEIGGTITFVGAAKIAVEEIRITDEKLKNEWGERLYRILVTFSGEKLSFIIND